MALSDAPVETESPLRGMYDAIFRNCGHEPSKQDQCFLPKERLTFIEALRLYTTWAAYASNTESHQGSIKSGLLCAIW